MTIFYLANARIPTEKAHGVQIMKMCEAFARLGHEVRLIIPKRISHIEGGAFEFYGMKKSFEIVYLPTLDLIRWSGWVPKVFAFLQNWSFSRSAQKYLQDHKADLLYSRDELTALSLARDSKVILEVHNISRILKSQRARLNSFQKIIVITSGLKNELVNLGYSADKIQILPDGVDLQSFRPLPAFSHPPQAWGGKGRGRTTVVYTGNFFAWKGIYVLAEAARLQPEYEFIFVGGSPDELEKFKNKVSGKNIRLAGFVPHSKIPEYLSQADVLVLPNSGKTSISKYYTSPLKMFEYMAAGKPIVASDLPSIREVLNETNSILVKPDDPAALAEGIKKVIENPESAGKIAAQAAEDVKKYTWENRANSILGH